MAVFFQAVNLTQSQPTKRSGRAGLCRIFKCFLASSFFCSQTESTPAHT